MMSGLSRLSQCQPSHQLAGQCTQDVRSHSAVSVPAISPTSRTMYTGCQVSLGCLSASLSPTGRTMYTGCQVSLGCLSASHLTNWPDNVHRMSGLSRLSQCQPSHQLAGQCTQDVRSHSAVSVPASHQLAGQCTQDVRSQSAVSVPASHQLAGQCTQDARSHSAVSVPASHRLAGQCTQDVRSRSAVPAVS